MVFLCVILVLYVLTIFIGLRLVVPFYGFKGYNAPKNIPEEIKVAILDLEASSHDQLSYLQNAYSLILDKNLHQWQHTRFQAVFKVPQAFITDLSELWSIKKFIYCTGINYVLLTLLVGSKYFKAEDIKTRHVFLNFITHQYLQVRVNEKWIDADPAGSGIRGRGLGTHASFFG